MAKQQALGFWRGFSTFFAAARSLLSLPSAWPYALVPAVVFTLLETTYVYLAYRFVRPWVEQLFPTDSTVWSSSAG